MSEQGGEGADIVERILISAQVADDPFGSYYSPDAAEALREAAAEIARLRAEVEALRRWCPRGEVRSASSDDGARGLGDRGGA